MKDQSNEIFDILTSKNMNSADMTHKLKNIGDGDMHNGFMKLFSVAKDAGRLEGNSSGFKKGAAFGISSVVVVGSIVYGGCELYKHYKENTKCSISKKEKTRILKELKEENNCANEHEEKENIQNSDDGILDNDNAVLDNLEDKIEEEK